MFIQREVFEIFAKGCLPSDVFISNFSQARMNDMFVKFKYDMSWNRQR